MRQPAGRVRFLVALGVAACGSGSGRGDGNDTASQAEVGDGAGGSDGDMGDIAGVSDAGDSPTTMRFVVEVPVFTPPEDVVYLESGNRDFTMTRVDARTWAIDLTDVDVDMLLEPERRLRYVYTRGHDYIGGEFFAEDPGQDKWRGHRATTFAPGSEQRDSILRWRFFPDPGDELPRHPVTPSGWQPRAGGDEYQAGFTIADYFSAYLAPLEATSDAALLAMGATWIQIDPPWDYTSFDPVPTIEYAPDHGQYNDDELRAHILRAKADGLKVLLAPQVCCTPVPTTGRSTAWWDGWFAAYRDFFLHHARIASETGVDAMMFEGHGFVALPANLDGPSDAHARFAAIFAAAHAAFKGPIGWSLLIHNFHDDTNLPTPWEDLAPVADGLDFLGVGLWRRVGEATSTAAEIDTAVEAMFTAKIDALHAKTPLPLVLTALAYPSYDGGARTDGDVYVVAGAPFFSERDTKLVWDGLEQAMVMDAIMKAVASRPFVTGTYPFNTTWVGLPKAPDYSVRGKPAGEVLRQWYGVATPP